MERIIVKLGSVILLLIIAINIPSVALGAKTPSFKPATPLGAPISQALTKGSTGAPPQEGVDYILGTPAYFQGNTWLVVAIDAKSSALNDSIVVLHKQAGMFTVALGPGSAFPSTQVHALPSDVAAYLERLGVVYEPQH